MRLPRSGIALLQALALGSTLVVWCPCPVASAAVTAVDAHACCRKSELALRSVAHDCCRPCHSLRALSDAETVATVQHADTAFVAPAAAAAAPFVAAVVRVRPVFLSSSPPSVSPPRPLRI
jgi:hypothetical protein